VVHHQDLVSLLCVGSVFDTMFIQYMYMFGSINSIVVDATYVGSSNAVVTESTRRAAASDFLAIVSFCC
jgi:hypothetical protein